MANPEMLYIRDLHLANSLYILETGTSTSNSLRRKVKLFYRRCPARFAVGEATTV